MASPRGGWSPTAAHAYVAGTPHDDFWLQAGQLGGRESLGAVERVPP